MRVRIVGPRTTKRHIYLLFVNITPPRFSNRAFANDTCNNTSRNHGTQLKPMLSQLNFKECSMLRITIICLTCILFVSCGGESSTSCNGAEQSSTSCIAEQDSLSDEQKFELIKAEITANQIPERLIDRTVVADCGLAVDGSSTQNVNECIRSNFSSENDFLAVYDLGSNQYRAISQHWHSVYLWDVQYVAQDEDVLISVPTACLSPELDDTLDSGEPSTSIFNCLHQQPATLESLDNVYKVYLSRDDFSEIVNINVEDSSIVCPAVTLSNPYVVEDYDHIAEIDAGRPCIEDALNNQHDFASIFHHSGTDSIGSYALIGRSSTVEIWTYDSAARGLTSNSRIYRSECIGAVYNPLPTDSTLDLFICAEPELDQPE